jgi:hypothetical protein
VVPQDVSLSDIWDGFAREEADARGAEASQ